ncbi:hypothetical protein ET475_04115 [Microbacterium protaetiae]|uniref:DUF4352 domain-containing protein n=1 Tax=Microbacterium protaetiae TaxID=2509458 RepID=A0A4P6EB72_9MICO|nr:hypothetical protein [Microbacterium protaetiae]QAY59254.1 hypothetical protein ET475_04115 [Microbacterium protaetiae]
MRFRSSLPLLIVGGIVASTALAGCSAGGDPDPVFPTAATGLPDATSLSEPGSTVAAGEWGVLQTYDSVGDPRVSVVAMKTGPVRKGTASDLDDVTIPGGLPDDSIAYYANISYSVLEGDHHASPMHQLTAVDTTSDEHATMLSVPSDLMNCPEQETEQATDVKQQAVGCLVFVMPEGTTPDAVVFTATHSDELDTDVSPLTFTLPAAESAS